MTLSGGCSNRSQLAAVTTKRDANVSATAVLVSPRRAAPAEMENQSDIDHSNAENENGGSVIGKRL
jgi:hypothetical protein